MKRNRKGSGQIIQGLSVSVIDGNINKALKIFNKKVQDSGLLRRIKETQHYVPPSEKKKLKSKMARKRINKKN